MKSYIYKGLSICLFICFSTLLQAQNVIIVVVDGARYTETFGAGNTYIPHMYDDMRPLGTLYTNFNIDYPSGHTETCPGHAAIETGTWQPIANDGSERPTKPTVFEYIRKEKGNPQSDCYAVTGKDKLDILTYSTFTGYGSDYGGTWFGDDDRVDSTTYSKVISVMQSYHPKILVINFAQVDIAGHTGNWNNYIAAITNADNYVFQLWQHIENGDWGYSPDNTTLFITNDHGRHDDAHGGFQSHGDGCYGCTHIMLLALGRGIAANQTSDFTTWQIDIAPTVGDLLEFQTPYSTGTSLLESPTLITIEHLQSFSEYKLTQNFPNPFNPSTIISYSVPKNSYVLLQVYDILGNHITTLVNEEKETGIYEVTFDASSLPSGMYLYELTAGSFRKIKKMILAK
ncbi:MAG: T9SS type A sorting domain-containing protein [Ignavibacteriaceae bacterium]|nr:T9SS type A sorting domain-containing protein [Ignavibacteriaceae bacterium]